MAHRNGAAPTFRRLRSPGDGVGVLAARHQDFSFVGRSARLDLSMSLTHEDCTSDVAQPRDVRHRCPIGQLPLRHLAPFVGQCQRAACSLKPCRACSAKRRLISKSGSGGFPQCAPPLRSAPIARTGGGTGRRTTPPPTPGRRWRTEHRTAQPFFDAATARSNGGDGMPVSQDRISAIALPRLLARISESRFRSASASAPGSPRKQLEGNSHGFAAAIIAGPPKSG